MNKMKGGVPKEKLPEGITEELVKEGAKTEASEHKWATPEQARKIALDHLRECGAGYYEALEEMEEHLHEGEGEEEGEEEEENE